MFFFFIFCLVFDINIVYLIWFFSDRFCSVCIEGEEIFEVSVEIEERCFFGGKILLFGEFEDVFFFFDEIVVGFLVNFEIKIGLRVLIFFFLNKILKKGIGGVFRLYKFIVYFLYFIIIIVYYWFYFFFEY